MRIQHSGSSGIFLVSPFVTGGLRGIFFYPWWSPFFREIGNLYNVYRFYPEFICKLEEGRILTVEYKNSRDYDLPDNEEKRRLGALWEMRR